VKSNKGPKDGQKKDGNAEARHAKKQQAKGENPKASARPRRVDYQRSNEPIRYTRERYGDDNGDKQ
jgi:hypothetical protein